MATPELKIKIGADVTNATSSINYLKGNLNGLLPVVYNSGLTFETLKSRVSNTTTFIDKAGKSFSALKPQIDKFKNSTNSALNTVTNFSRVIQDIPFGFLGIANNLNPLSESFGRLKAETGSSKAAFAALGSSILGAGGIGIAISIASALLSKFGDSLLKSSEDSNKSKESIDEYKNTIDALNKSLISARGESNAEIALVSKLGNIAADTSNSYQIRKRAIEELKNINKEYFGSLDSEKIKYEQITQAINSYSSALVNSKIKEKLSTAIADATVNAQKFKSEFDSITEKINLREQKIRNNVAENTQALFEFETGSKEKAPTKLLQDNLNKARKNDSKLLGLYKAQQAAAEEWGKYNDLIGQYNVDLDDAVKNTLSFKSLSENTLGNTENILAKIKSKIDEANKEGITLPKVSLTGSKDELEKALKLIEDEIEAQKNGLKQLSDLRIKNLDTIYKNEYLLGKKRIEEKYNQELLDIEKLETQNAELKRQLRVNLDKRLYSDLLLLQKKFGIDSESIQKGVIEKLATSRIDPKYADKLLPKPKKDDNETTWSDYIVNYIEGNLDEAAQAMTNFWSELGLRYKNGYVDFSNIVKEGIVVAADAIGSTLGKGGSIGQALANAGEGILQVLGYFLQDLGKKLLTVGAIMVNIRKAITAAITNPVALVIAATGLIVLGGVLKNVSLSKVPAFAEGGIVTGPTMGLVGEAGKEAIIPLDRIGEVLGSIGGSQNVFVTGQLSGETIYLQQQRVSQRRGRFV